MHATFIPVCINRHGHPPASSRAAPPQAESTHRPALRASRRRAAPPASQPGPKSSRSPPGKGCNRAGPSSRDEAGALQHLLHRTQERWWPSANPGSASLEPGFAQAPVQDADAQVHDQMHSAPGLVCSDRPEGRLLSRFDPSATDRFYGSRLKVGHGSTGSSPSGSPCLPLC